ncbi:MAG: URC4/urg3 family protein [Pseudorhodoplanes sp.]|nr:URC4/urg3 family protein [Pseudorhodoplanes sp.]
MSNPQAAALSLLTAAAVRERTHEILQAGLNGALEHFAVDPDRLPAVADFVAGVIRDKYPDLKVPLHARWRHFVHGGEDLWARIASMRSWPDAAAKARSAFDLAIVSVLLDAGAGPAWRYRDAITGASAGRSEGLALASLRMFEAGVFSADPRDPLRADAARLMQLSESDLAAGFQASADNALDGLAGRADLLVRLGRVVAERADVFALADAARPGGLFDHLAAPGDPVAAPAILYALLLHLGAIWPARLTLDGVVLGDTWRHPAIRRADVTDGFVPFHKLSQWLAYSLIEPLRDAGLSVSDVDGLTGLAEYRNGGLFVDLGAIALRDPAQMQRAHAIDSTLVVEWRALTVALLDVLAPLVRTMLGVDAARFPLGCVLEGGTWAAGRKIAQALRTDGRPPFAVVSDGTVF